MLPTTLYQIPMYVQYKNVYTPPDPYIGFGKKTTYTDDQPKIWNSDPQYISTYLKDTLQHISEHLNFINNWELIYGHGNIQITENLYMVLTGLSQ